MKFFNPDFLIHQAIPLKFAGILRLLGEYCGKQELSTKQMTQILNTLRPDILSCPAESTLLAFCWQHVGNLRNRVGEVSSGHGFKTVCIRWLLNSFSRGLKHDSLSGYVQGSAVPSYVSFSKHCEEKGK